MFQQELGDGDDDLLWIGQILSIDDVNRVVLRAKSKYDSKPNSKARKWLGIFSTKLMYYSPVLDILSQYHSEYVSLVWGVMKFMFMVSRRVIFCRAYF
jgi:hypothetical protein